MALEQKLSLKLAQKLVMTPSLQQAIKLLQMTRMELQTVVAQELVENPVLEEGDETYETEDSNEESEEEEGAEAAAEETATDELDHQESMDDIDLDAYFNDYLEGSTGPAVFEAREAPPLENTLTREPDLYEHLLWQLHMSDVSERLREIAEVIIGNLDPDGFLVASKEEIQLMGWQEEPGHSYTPEEVEEALALVQAFDPPGVACHSLKESLSRQLDARAEPPDSLARRIIDEAWELFLKRQFQQIARQLDVPLSDLEPVVESIRGLQIRPGRKFSTERTHYVEPDVHITNLRGKNVSKENDDVISEHVNRAADIAMKRGRLYDRKYGDASKIW